MKKFEVDSEVQWKWMGRAILGTVKEVHLCPVEKVIKGKKIKRNGSEEKPAYLVESDAGNLALKLHTELELREAKPQRNKVTPSMFE